MQSYWSLHGLLIQTEYASKLLEQLVSDVLHHRNAAQVRSPAPCDFRVSLFARKELVPSPEEAEFLLTYRDTITVHKTEAQYFLSHEGAILTVDPKKGCVHGTLRISLLRAEYGTAYSVVKELLSLALSILLRFHGYFVLHAAALVHENQGALFIGRSSSGKTTLTLALLQNGWEYITDDAVLLHLQNEYVEALSFCNDLSLLPDTTALLPDSSVLPSKQKVAHDQKITLSAETCFPDQMCLSAEPSMLVFMQRLNQPASSLVPISSFNAFISLLESNLFFLTPDDRIHQRHQKIFEHLIHQTRAFEFTAGYDVLKDPASVAHLLEQAKA